MPDDTALMNHAQEWMRRRGWKEVSEGPAGTMWVNPMADDDRRVGVLRSLTPDSFQFRDLVERLSAVHSVPPEEIADSLKNWAVDVTYVSAANDVYITDSIPLTAGVTMLESVRLMFRSAATAAVRPRPAINGGFSKLGDAVADQVRMGHTIGGSYVIPVLVPVGIQEEPEGSIFTESDLSTGFESIERRATRTFAQAFAAVHDEIVKPEESPSGEQLQRLITRGVTREFAAAIAKILTTEAVATLNTEFNWAPAQGEPAGTPEAVTITSEAAPKVKRVSERLRSVKRPSYEVFTGPVVVVAREPWEEPTRFAIRTVRNGKPCRVESITFAPLTDVLDWMNNGTIIQVSGNVTRQAGSLQIQKPREVTAFEELGGKQSNVPGA
jgi:hypothetical protein